MTEHDLIYRAALLAGLGRAAYQIGSLPARAAGDDRTCIDGGSDLLFAVSAPGARALRLWRRGADRGTVQRWQAWFGIAPVARIDLFDDDGGRAPAAALTGARGWHAPLAANGSVYRIERPQSGPAWVAYRLNRQTQPQAVLQALGLTAAWQMAADIWAHLLGRRLPARSRPWSIAAPVDGMGGQVRIGSTLWALLPEQPGKHRQLATLVQQLGGDARYAEALYKLLAQTSDANHAAPIVGAAVELTLTADGTLLAADFVLRARPAAESIRLNHEDTMEHDLSYLNKINPQTANYLTMLPEDDNPIVSVAIEWAHTPSDADLDAIDLLGGVWQGGDTPAIVPSFIQTLRLPVRAVPALAQLDSIASVDAAVPLGYGDEDDDDMPPPQVSLGF